MNSSRADMLADEVPSRMTSTLGHSGAASNRSWKCLLHAARMILCALNVTPGIKIVHDIYLQFPSTVTKQDYIGKIIIQRTKTKW